MMSLMQLYHSGSRWFKLEVQCLLEIWVGECILEKSGTAHTNSELFEALGFTKFQQRIFGHFADVLFVLNQQ